MQFVADVDLTTKNTLAVPSRCDWFCAPENMDDIFEAIGWAKKRAQKINILGGGSNLLLAEKISGLVIQPKIKGIDILAEEYGDVLIRVGAGEIWEDLVNWAEQNSLSGIENLTLIPGTVGAAPIQNIGAYGCELKDVFEQLTAINLESGAVDIFDREGCRFAYRESIFKRELDQKYIITHVVLRLSRSPKLNLSYPALANAFVDRDISQIGSKEVLSAIRQIRQTKLPDPKVIPNAGSFFQNPVISQLQYEQLKAEYPLMPCYHQPNRQVKIPAGWLIEQAGWRGRQKNGIKIHERQALVLTNPEGCSVDVIYSVARQIQSDVQGLFSIHLDIEPRYIS
ncbi:UDP-N-acetylmuramate dehydrogenase [Teredinibacter sp. KSP-S5-2]|uniref:UDP-N-acetylmuramate dehydrogenase n=1 Tax=Teredinibacter sp. KSP-S5-2 TaxID=3034506 RepID=UPI0029342C6E|nr:UDP-N-acetylmuramate dehydrogenase [Teredinibacter sp. KSP-S5-2]WNO11262.1 UDP-N-acetylmuramate dehydrogenase [Teredinibacter sp. KSP-S5-2]